MKTGVDNQHRWLEYVAAAAFILCVLDGIMTVIWVLTEHAEEANPMMDHLLNMHPLLFMVVKMTLTALGIGLLWRYRHNRLAVGWNLRRLEADPARLRRWHRADKIDRVGHGIYRFRQIPSTPLDSYMLATLWPSGRGILSHDTALELHELCDINPDRIHLALPVHYRPRRQGGERYILHYENLDNDEISWHEGIRIVTPAIAIRQAVSTSVPNYLVRQAIENAGRLGLVPKETLAPLTEQLERRN